MNKLIRLLAVGLIFTTVGAAAASVLLGRGTLNVNVLPPIKIGDYVVYSDAGMPSGSEIWTWDGSEWGYPPGSFDGTYEGESAPEGEFCFKTTSGGSSNNYAGWGIFLIYPSDHTVDLSKCENLKFWVKTPKNLKIEIQMIDRNGPKKYVYISNYGWDGTNTWQEIEIPKSAFSGADFTKVFSPFAVTITGGNKTFYIDYVRWVGKPGFSVSVSPYVNTVRVGSSDTATVLVVGNYDKKVTLTAEGVPPEVNVTFSPNDSVPTFVSSMTIQVGEHASPGIYDLVIKGTGEDETVDTCSCRVVIYDSEDDWPTLAHDFARTGYTMRAGPSDNNLLWSYKLGQHLGATAPVVADGKVYVGTSTVYTGGRNPGVYCLNVDTGALVWKYVVGSTTTTPTVEDGKVYFQAESYVYCLDKENGDFIWKYPTGTGPGYASPAVINGKVYVGTTGSLGALYCLDADTGDLIWKLDGEVLSSPAAVGDRVYVVMNVELDPKLYCVDANTGASLWTYGVGWSLSAPAVVGDKVYVGSGENKVYCLDAVTGSYLWSYSTGDRVDSSPAVAGGRVYVTSWDGNVYCLDSSTGGLIWKKSAGSLTSGSPAVANDKVYVGAYGEVYCYDADTGDVVWKYETPSEWGHIKSISVAYGRVFFGSFDSYVYCVW